MCSRSEEFFVPVCSTASLCCQSVDWGGCQQRSAQSLLYDLIQERCCPPHLPEPDTPQRQLPWSGDKVGTDVNGRSSGLSGPGQGHFLTLCGIQAAARCGASASQESKIASMAAGEVLPTQAVSHLKYVILVETKSPRNYCHD